MTDWFDRACKAIPGGVNSPVRAFGSVRGQPVFVSKGEGPWITSEEGTRYLDLCMSWGPLILGHADPVVVETVQKKAKDGLTFGACHRQEVELAETILCGYPWAERVRMMSSGTEAVMTAGRLARAVTGRPLLLKFDGGYHGHSDGYLVKAGSGLATQAIANSDGVPEAIAGCTRVLDLDDLEAAKALFAEEGDSIAAVVIEPLPANNGLLIQRQRFLAGLRDLCDQYGALLLFDEVISGFRLRYGGVGPLFGVQPDLVTLGKIMGGGLPMGAMVGTADVMDRLAPVGPVYQAGTLSGNPLSVAAGLATLQQLFDPKVYDELERKGALVENMLQQADLEHMQVVRMGSILWLYASGETPPRRAVDVDGMISERFGSVHEAMLRAGFYLPPSAYEVCFVSLAHTDAQLSSFAQALVEASRTTTKQAAAGT
ncbi:MAG: aspartate aminotransferase family protein [Myxococcales bacterium]|nr:aspartate aminotransferase family protein [Myxococcales bacterium]